MLWWIQETWLPKQAQARTLDLHLKRGRKGHELGNPLKPTRSPHPLFKGPGADLGSNGSRRRVNSGTRTTKYLNIHQWSSSTESLARHCPGILARITQLKLEFIFEYMGECNLDWVRKFYANWFPNIRGNEVKIRGQIINLTAELLNSHLGTPEVDHSRLKELYSKSPYRAIRHIVRFMFHGSVVLS